MHVEHGMKCGAPTITLPFRLRGIQMHGVCILLIGDMKLIIVPYFVDMHACPCFMQRSSAVGQAEAIDQPQYSPRENNHAQQTDQQRL